MERPAAGAAGDASATVGSGKIVFVRGGPPRIWVMRPGGGRARRLPPRDVNGGVRFSWNGRRLFWASFGQKCFAADSVGRGARLLYTPRSLGTYTGCPVTSRSGRAIAFTRIARPPPGFNQDVTFAQVVVANRRARRARRLPAPASMSALAWSPDGRRLAASGEKMTWGCVGLECVEGYETSLWVLPTSGRTPTTIMTSAEGDHFWRPDWSPDGRLIAFHRQTATDGDSLGQIWVVRPDAGEPRQVTHLPRGAANPSWSPNGRFIAFDVKTGKRRVDIAIIRPDGSGFRRLTHDGRSYLPDWAP